MDIEDRLSPFFNHILSVLWVNFCKDVDQCSTDLHDCAMAILVSFFNFSLNECIWDITGGNISAFQCFNDSSEEGSLCTHCGT